MPEFELPRLDELPADWFLLLLRVLFAFLLYFFLYQLIRVQSRELIALATATAPRGDPERSVLGRLTMLDGGESDLGPGTVFVLGPASTVGRRSDCTVEIDEPFVSAEHAELIHEHGSWWVRDLGSTNGTFVNGQPVRVPTGIQTGDVVQFGRVKLQLVL